MSQLHVMYHYNLVFFRVAWWNRVRDLLNSSSCSKKSDFFDWSKREWCKGSAGLRLKDSFISEWNWAIACVRSCPYYLLTKLGMIWYQRTSPIKGLQIVLIALLWPVSLWAFTSVSSHWEWILGDLQALQKRRGDIQVELTCYLICCLKSLNRWRNFWYVSVLCLSLVMIICMCGKWIGHSFVAPLS